MRPSAPPPVIILAIVEVVIILLLIFLRKRILIAIALIKEASRSVRLAQSRRRTWAGAWHLSCVSRPGS